MNVERQHVATVNPIIERFSWSAIIAGVFMTLAIFISLMLLGLSLGLAVMDFENGISLTATSWFTGIWTVLSFLIALAAATFSTARLTGQPSRISGVLNGLTVWAVVSVFMFYAVTKSTGQVVASTSGAVTSQLKGMTESATGGMLNQSNLEDINLQGIEDIYKDIDAPELKSDLEAELKKLKADASQIAKDMLINPSNTKSSIEKLKSSAKESVANIRKEYDEEKIAGIIAKNSELSKAEAEKAAREWEMKLDGMAEEMDKVFEKIETEVVDVADSAKNSVATTSFLMFLFLCLGFVVTIFASSAASRKYHNY